ncbi:hypothetical protein ACS0TY_031400 [Phlomoides rotata]
MHIRTLLLRTSASLEQPLLPVAVIGFFAKLAVIVGGPLVGKLMDYFPRVPAYNCLTVIQLAGTNRPIALAQANAILSRIDLLCEMAGASLFGIFLSKYETVMCLKLVARLMMWSLPILVVLTWLTNMLSTGVLGHAKCPQTDFGCLSTGSIHDAENISSLAYVLLYFNVALAPGGLMTAFLTQHVPNFRLYFKPQLLNMTHFIPPNLLHLSNFSILPGYQQHTK